MALYAYRCRDCGLLTYPRPCLCRGCGGRDFEQVSPEGPCRLITWTRLSALPCGYDGTSRSFGIAEFGSGLRVTGVLDCDAPAVGMELTAASGVVRTHPDGPPETGFVFRPRKPG